MVSSHPPAWPSSLTLLLSLFLQSYSVHCEGELLGLCWECPKLTCYGNYFLKMWHVSQFESHFASLNADVLRLSRVDGSRPTKSSMRTARILAQTDVSVMTVLSKLQ